MPTRPSKNGRKDRTPRAPKAPVGIVVRQGALRRFHSITREALELPVVVLWDRRKGDRRRSPAAPAPDARRAERRKAPPFTWTAADFLVLDRVPKGLTAARHVHTRRSRRTS